MRREVLAIEREGVLILPVRTSVDSQEHRARTARHRGGGANQQAVHDSPVPAPCREVFGGAELYFLQPRVVLP
jgi:hypothetical protein